MSSVPKRPEAVTFAAARTRGEGFEPLATAVLAEAAPGCKRSRINKPIGFCT